MTVFNGSPGVDPKIAAPEVIAALPGKTPANPNDVRPTASVIEQRSWYHAIRRRRRRRDAATAKSSCLSD